MKTNKLFCLRVIEFSHVFKYNSFLCGILSEYTKICLFTYFFTELIPSLNLSVTTANV